tara:strand:- start:231 stop:470 length:240 start_codon:yes stop_codon:yes gene_type:complete
MNTAKPTINKKDLITLIRSNNEFKINSMGRMRKKEILEIVDTYPYIIELVNGKYELVYKSLADKKADKEELENWNNSFQ